MAAAPAAPDAMPAAPIVSESLWVACVDAAYAAGDPSDGTLGACDARYGSHWTYPETA
jgi:hypothetical protein